MKLSKNLSLREAVKSTTAKRLGIKNEPSEIEVLNLKAVSKNVFQPIRDNFGVPIYVSSGFRSKELNESIGGSATSQHCQGRALDLDADVFGGVSNADIFFYIKECLDFDQLIWEFGDGENPDWVHVSYASQENNRNRVLKAYKDPEYPGTTYKVW